MKTHKLSSASNYMYVVISASLHSYYYYVLLQPVAYQSVQCGQ
jgi:hypothetical protein